MPSLYKYEDEYNMYIFFDSFDLMNINQSDITTVILLRKVYIQSIFFPLFFWSTDF